MIHQQSIHLIQGLCFTKQPFFERRAYTKTMASNNHIVSTCVFLFTQPSMHFKIPGMKSDFILVLDTGSVCVETACGTAVFPSFCTASILSGKKQHQHHCQAMHRMEEGRRKAIRFVVGVFTILLNDSE